MRSPWIHADPLDPATIEELRRRLERREQELIGEFLAAERSLETIEEEERLSPSRELDRLAAAMDRREDREKHELREVRLALARIAEGTYGICETCGGAIGVATLQSNPRSRFCSSCGPPPASPASRV